jgi:acetylornithine aminotransferase
MTEMTIQKADQVFASTYSRFPIVLTRGQECTLWDSEGRSYTDFLAGIAVCNLGHAHPNIAEALCNQAKILFHVSNLYYTAPQTELAELLVSKSFADRVFFCNSGAEANEAALKLVRKFFKKAGQPHRLRIVAMEKSFHGRTMATLSATGQEKIQEGFDPVLEGFDFVPFNNLNALTDAVKDETAAVMLEPIQGEGGVKIPDPGYLEGVRKLCDETGTLLIFDEIQTGMGRTGKLFAYEHTDITPDIMTLAKALGNGLPIGAMLAIESVAEAFTPGSHASTFGGTPIITAAALEAVKTIDQPDILNHCLTTGAYFLKGLEELKQQHAIIREVRGKGLLLGMQLSVNGDPVVRQCMKKGFLINCIQMNVLRFAPPLIIKKSDIDKLIEVLNEIFLTMN